MRPVILYVGKVKWEYNHLDITRQNKGSQHGSCARYRPPLSRPSSGVHPQFFACASSRGIFYYCIFPFPLLSRPHPRNPSSKAVAYRARCLLHPTKAPTGKLRSYISLLAVLESGWRAASSKLIAPCQISSARRCPCHRFPYAETAAEVRRK